MTSTASPMDTLVNNDVTSKLLTSLIVSAKCLEFKLVLPAKGEMIEDIILKKLGSNA